MIITIDWLCILLIAGLPLYAAAHAFYKSDEFHHDGSLAAKGGNGTTFLRSSASDTPSLDDAVFTPMKYYKGPWG